MVSGRIGGPAGSKVTTGRSRPARAAAASVGRRSAVHQQRG